MNQFTIKRNAQRRNLLKQTETIKALLNDLEHCTHPQDFNRIEYFLNLNGFETVTEFFEVIITKHGLTMQVINGIANYYASEIKDAQKIQGGA